MYQSGGVAESHTARTIFFCLKDCLPDAHQFGQQVFQQVEA